MSKPANQDSPAAPAAADGLEAQVRSEVEKLAHVEALGEYAAALRAGEPKGEPQA